MDEYVATVLMEGEKTPTELKSFGITPEEVVDNMVLLPNVEYLYHITRLRDEEVWDFDTELEPLRELRKMITENGGDIGLKISITTDDEDNTPLH
tara:strand:+ start:3138 stop:3422 length:285 start_codon:yes stop_codon:yes gene_type:complete